jgi:hypothetical protein
MKRILSGVALALVLAGCSTESAPAPAETTAPAPPAATTPAASNDLTDTVKTLADKDGEVITSAIEEEPGRIVVETTLVDPRGKDGSPEAKRALAICEMLASKDDVNYVNIKESDGTSWVLFGHPMVTEGECGEV